MKKLSNLISNLVLVYIILSILIVILLSVLSYFISPYTNTNNFFIDISYIFINSLISILLVGLLWQLVEKKIFAQELFNLAKISNNLKESGISFYYDSFLDISWDDKLNESKQFKIFFTYGLTFIEHNRIKIEKAIKNGLEVDVFYPNFKSKEIINELSLRFNKQDDPTWLTGKINESILLLKDLGANVYLFDGNITNSYYLFDNIAYISFFNHNIKKKSVPCFEAKKDGKLFKFITEEIKSIESRSKTFDEEQL